MITPNIILSKLSPFNNYKRIVVDDQTTTDIINGLLQNHTRYKSEYDKISEIFLGNNVKETARNIFDFLKTNVKYYIEPTQNQTLRSPSAIVAMPMGADCKSYASFILGVYDSLNRKGIYNVPLAYRFASYKDYSKNPQHVFAVLYPNTDHEIWIDPVLEKFDQKKQPTYYKDKKLTMALIAMSGVNTQGQPSLLQLQDIRDKLVSVRDRLLINGTLTPNSSKELEYKVAINKVTKAIQNASISGVDPYASVRGYGDIGENGSDNDGGINWSDLIKNLIDTTGKVIVSKNQGGGGGGYVAPEKPTSNNGISTNTLLLIGAGGLLLYFIVKK